MSANFSGSLIGLSLLSGNLSLGASFSAMPFESRAVRKAKAQFTAPPVTPPWQQPKATTSETAQVSAIKRLASLIDTPSAREKSLLPDIQTAFTTFKALDRLRLLAETAAKPQTSSFERTQLEKSFAKGMADIQDFLASAPSDRVQLSFGTPTRRAESVGIPAQPSDGKLLGAGVLATRDAALPGVVGNEVLKVALTRNGQTETVTVDLAQTPQPPTLDSVATALNAAIMAIPMRNVDGTIVLDASGDPKPKFNARFEVDKGSGKWGLALNAPSFEKVALDQVGAKDALIVATGSTALDSPTATQIKRFDDPATSLAHKTLGSFSAIDREATERAALLPVPKSVPGVKPEPVQVLATTTARAIATAPDGSSYVVGTASGDLGSNRSDGGEDLFLTKLDSEGKLLWQRTLGAAGSAQGAAVTIAPDGDIVVAGTVTGPFNGSVAADDGDMVVVRFTAEGEEKFATAIRRSGNEEAAAVAVAADGWIFVGGRASSGGGDAFIARLDAAGALKQRHIIDGGGSERVTALAIDSSGELLAVIKDGATASLRRLDTQALDTELGRFDLGTADVRAIAVSASGEIGLAGATQAALAGTQIGAPSGGRDGFVARIDGGLSAASITYVGSDADDQIDSLAYMGDALYVGGRTTGALDGARRGAVDGFVGRLDAATGAVESVSQFGQPALRNEPVRIAAAAGGAGIAGALGFRRGTLNPDIPQKLVSQTSLRAGDSFTVRVDGGAARKIMIEADDTLATLSDRIRRVTGSTATVSTPKAGATTKLRVETKAGHMVELIAGPDGADALAKLGIEPSRLAAPAVAEDDEPRVKPGGAFGLSLKEAMGIGSVADAKVALGAITSALSMTQTAFRSLYWDDAKAARADGTFAGIGGGGASPYQQAQLARYQDALSRISAITGSF